MNTLTSFQEVISLSPISLKNDGTVIGTNIFMTETNELASLIGADLLELMRADLVTNEWNGADLYETGDQVMFSGFGYIATVDNDGEKPVVNGVLSQFWAPCAQFHTTRFRDLWDAGLNKLMAMWILKKSLPFINAQITASGVMLNRNEFADNAGLSGGNSIPGLVESFESQCKRSINYWLALKVGGTPNRSLFPEWTIRPQSNVICGMSFDEPSTYYAFPYVY